MKLQTTHPANSAFPVPNPPPPPPLVQRLTELPPETRDRILDRLQHGTIDEVGRLLYRAGICCGSAELYEYRLELFPWAGREDLAAPQPQPDANLTPAPSAPPTSPAPDSPPDQPKPASEHSQPPSATLPGPAPATVPEPPAAHDPAPADPPALQPESESESVTETPPGPESPAPDPAPTHTDPKLDPKRRGKIARLPKEVRDELNTRLENGQSYKTIVRWLARNGHRGFNSQNLTNWKQGGYQDWRRENERIESQVMQREWLAEQVAKTQPGELFGLIDQLFVSQLMDSLFGLDTATMKARLAGNPRHFIALFNAFNRYKRQAMDLPEFQEFLLRQKERKNGQKKGISPESMHEIDVLLGVEPPGPYVPPPRGKGGHQA